MRKDSDPAIAAAVEELRATRLVSVEVRNWNEGLSFLDDYIEAVKKYYELLTQAQQRGIAVENIPEHIEGGNPRALFDILHIPTFGIPVSTILILEDTGRQKCFTNEASNIVNYLRILRELQLTVFILSHSFQDFAPGVKNNLTQVVLCRGVSNDRLAIIHRQTSSGLTWKEFRDAYRQMPSRYMIVNNRNNSINFL
jgi:hypothetical protein